MTWLVLYGGFDHSPLGVTVYVSYMSVKCKLVGISDSRDNAMAMPLNTSTEKYVGRKIELTTFV